MTAGLLQFHWPWAALLLPLPWLLAWRWPRRTVVPAPVPGERATLLHPRLAALRAAYGGQTPGTLRGGRGYRALLALLWLLLVLALMGPERLEPRIETASPGYDLLLAVDASHSMDALDFSVGGRQVSRMAVVKGVMGRFVDSRVGDRVGLIVFGSGAYVLAPLSVDRAAVRALLDEVVPSIAGASTALGDAIALGVKKLRERPAGARVLVLIADGDNTAGGFQPLEAAALARQAGVRIYVIGVGSEQNPIPILHEGRIEYWDDLAMDETVLRQIAATTDGAYFRATDTRALEEISRRIGALEKTAVASRTIWIPQPLYRWPLGVALAILLIIGLWPEGQRRLWRA